MKIALVGFKGEVPRLDSRLLPEGYGAVARNTTFENGTLAPLRGMASEYVFGSDVNSIHYFNGAWLGWAGIVDVAPAPVAANRIYFTGDGVPKVRDLSATYALALQAPIAAPTAINLSVPDPNFVETTYFAYTYVTALGEESQPSPLSVPLDTTGIVTVQIGGFSAPPVGRAITAIRIYRSQTSATGATSLYFVAEISTATTSFNHSLAALPLGEMIPSIDYDPPPAGLIGLTAMPNGMMAAFLGKDLYFSEPYVPHAWPEKYVLTMDYEIVGLASFGSNLAVLTAGTPYILQGTHPESMASEKMEVGLPCLSRRGIVDIGYAAIYPSTEGLVMISAGEAKVISKGLFTRSQWQFFNPSSIVAERFKGQYLFLRNVSAFTVYVGGGPAGYTPLERTDLAGSGPTLAGDPSAYVFLSGGTYDSSFGEQRLGIVDLDGEAPFFVQTDIAQPRSMLNEPYSSDLFCLGSDLRTVSRWEDPGAPVATYVWRSKVFSSALPTSFAAVFVRTFRPLVDGDVFLMRIYGDGVLMDTVMVANRAVRPRLRGFAREWEIEITSTVAVVSAEIAGSMDELVGAA